MNDDELKKIWREQTLTLPPSAERPNEIACAKEKMKKLDRALWLRDLRELGAVVIVITIFGLYFVWFPSRMVRVGCVVTILGAAFIGARLLWSRRQAGPEIPGAPVADSLRRELRKVEIQIEMLRTVLWWYLLPLNIGGTLFFFGVNRDVGDRTIWVAVQIALDLFVDWLNQRAVRKKLVPLKVELETLLDLPVEERKPVKSNRIKNMFIVILLTCAVVWLLASKTASLYAQGKPRTDADINAMLDLCVTRQHRAPGIVAAVIDTNGSRIYSCSRTGELRVNGDTVFEIGSVTKTFTAILLQEMADDGEVSLDDPIGKFLPASVKTPTRNGRQITLGDLGAQTSGLPRLPDNMRSRDPANPYADYTVGDLYEFLSHYELTRDIGKKYEYSNLGVGLLGHVLALRAGTNYEALVVRRVCDPLGLASTRITLTPELRARLAQGYSAAGIPTENWDIPTLAGAGGLRSTANDLAKFVAANMGLTSSPLSNAMTQTHQARRSIGRNRKIGLIWQIDTAHHTLWHNGGTGGYRSYIGFKSDGSRGVVVLANSANDIDDIGQYLLGDRAKVEDFTGPTTHTVAKIDPRIFDDFAGEYKFPLANVTITMTREGNRLFGQMTGQGKLEFYPESDSDVFCGDVDAQMTFVRDSSGKVAYLVLHQNGFDQKVTKVK